MNEALAPLQSDLSTTWGKLKGKFFGVPLEFDTELGTALEKLGKGGKWMVNPSIFSKPVQEAAPKVRNILDEAFKNLT